MTAERVVEESLTVKRRLLADDDRLATIDRVGRQLATTLDDGGQVVLFGNGGSAADAQHIAAELAGKFRRDRPPLPALAATTNSSAVTAIANDYGYETVFARQLRGLVDAGDAVIGISTSGTSTNVVRGLRTANDCGATTVGLTGETGGDVIDVADETITVPSRDTARIQEAHITVGHAVCRIVEEAIYG